MFHNPNTPYDDGYTAQRERMNELAEKPILLAILLILVGTLYYLLKPWEIFKPKPLATKEKIRQQQGKERRSSTSQIRGAQANKLQMKLNLKTLKESTSSEDSDSSSYTGRFSALSERCNATTTTTTTTSKPRRASLPEEGSPRTQYVLEALNKKREDKLKNKEEDEKWKEQRKTRRVSSPPRYNSSSSTDQAKASSSTPRSRTSSTSTTPRSLTSSTGTPKDTTHLAALIWEHKRTIEELRSLHKELKFLNARNALEKAEKLHFQQLARFPSEYDSQMLCKDLEICARIGVDIKRFMSEMSDIKYFMDDLKRNDIATLLFACFLHDANTAETNQIHSCIISCLINKIDPIIQNEAMKVPKEIDKQGTSILKAIFTDGKDRFKDQSLRETQQDRYLLDAGTFYSHYGFSQCAIDHLKTFVASDSHNTDSDQQHFIADHAKRMLAGFQVAVVIEGETGVSAYSADVLILDLVNGKKFIIEYDGGQHYYLRGQDRDTGLLRREDVARDKNFQKAGIPVLRCTRRDLPNTQRLNRFLGELTTKLTPKAVVSLVNEVNNKEETQSTLRLG